MNAEIGKHVSLIKNGRRVAEAVFVDKTADGNSVIEITKTFTDKLVRGQQKSICPDVRNDNHWKLFVQPSLLGSFLIEYQDNFLNDEAQ